MKTAQPSSQSGAYSRRGDPTGHIRMSVTERRNHRRGAITSQAKLIIRNESYTAVIVDISAGGAQVRCTVVPRTGTEIAIEISGLGLLPARVIRRLPNSIAVEFYLTPSQRETFAATLDTMIIVHA